MNISGSDVSKEAANMILLGALSARWATGPAHGISTDDNFASTVSKLEEFRHRSIQMTDHLLQMVLPKDALFSQTSNVPSSEDCLKCVNSWSYLSCSDTQSHTAHRKLYPNYSVSHTVNVSSWFCVLISIRCRFADTPSTFRYSNSCYWSVCLRNSGRILNLSITV